MVRIVFSQHLLGGQQASQLIDVATPGSRKAFGIRFASSNAPSKGPFELVPDRCEQLHGEAILYFESEAIFIEALVDGIAVRAFGHDDKPSNTSNLILKPRTDRERTLVKLAFGESVFIGLSTFSLAEEGSQDLHPKANNPSSNVKKEIAIPETGQSEIILDAAIGEKEESQLFLSQATRQSSAPQILHSEDEPEDTAKVQIGSSTIELSRTADNIPDPTGNPQRQTDLIPAERNQQEKAENCGLKSPRISSTTRVVSLVSRITEADESIQLSEVTEEQSLDSMTDLKEQSSQQQGSSLLGTPRLSFTKKRKLDSNPDEGLTDARQDSDTITVPRPLVKVRESPQDIDQVSTKRQRVSDLEIRLPPAQIASPARSEPSSLGPLVSGIVFAQASALGNSAACLKFLKRKKVKIVDSMEKADVLVVGGMDDIKRTAKLLTAVLMGKFIVTDDWVTDSFEVDQIKSPEPYLAHDSQKQQEWGTTLEEALARGRQGVKPLSNWSIATTPALRKFLGKKVLEDVRGQS